MHIQEAFDYIAENIVKVPLKTKEPNSVDIKETNTKNEKTSGGCCEGSSKPKKTQFQQSSKELSPTKEQYDASAWEIDIYREYVFPYHLTNFNNQRIKSIACDNSFVGISDTGKIHIWGGPGLQSESDDILLSSNFTLVYLQQYGIKSVSSSGSELVALDNDGKVYVNTMYGAPVLLYAPQKLIALKVFTTLYN